MCDADQLLWTWHARWKRSWVSRKSTRFGPRGKQTTRTAARTRDCYLLTADARSRTDGFDKEVPSASTRSARDSDDMKKRGAQRAGHNRGDPPRGRILIHQMGRQSRLGTRRGPRQPQRTLLLCDQLLFGRERSLVANRLIAGFMFLDLVSKSSNRSS